MVTTQASHPRPPGPAGLRLPTSETLGGQPLQVASCACRRPGSTVWGFTGSRRCQGKSRHQGPELMAAHGRKEGRGRVCYRPVKIAPFSKRRLSSHLMADWETRSVLTRRPDTGRPWGRGGLGPSLRPCRRSALGRQGRLVVLLLLRGFPPCSSAATGCFRAMTEKLL